MLKNERAAVILEILLAGLMSLFFLQLLTDFVAGIYAYALMGTGIPPEIALFVLFFSPIILWVSGKAFTGRSLIVLGELILICRVIEPLLDTRGRMIVSGIGVALFLLFIPSMLWVKSRQMPTPSGATLTAGLGLGVMLGFLLKALNSTVDLTLDGVYLWIGWLLVFAAAWLLLVVWRRRDSFASQFSDPGLEIRPVVSSARVIAPTLGLVGVIMLFYMAFASPGVFAGWTEENYWMIVTLAAGSLAVTAFLMTAKPAWFANPHQGLLLLWNGAFLVALMLTILPHQLNFPQQPEGYPFYELPPSRIAALALVLTVLLYPVLMVDYQLFIRRAARSAPTPRQQGMSFCLGALYILLLVLGHVFTTGYDYVPVVGPFFRDKFWLVYLIAGVTPLLALVLSGRVEKVKGAEDLAPKIPHVYAWGMLLTAALVSIGAWIVQANTPQHAVDRSQLVALTYNIRQGYSGNGLKNYDGQLELIRSINPDLIGLQESDTNRIANGNADVARYFADRLNMHLYFGPKTVTGTFGIALLSKYPIENAKTFYMYSEGEQTATIEAQVNASGITFNVYVTHLGNDGPMVQQENFLQAVDVKANVIAMGDFNFRPDTEQYRLTTGVLDDAWLLKWPGGADDQGNAPAKRIDHIFVSPGTAIQEARYLTDPQSDHPALFVVVEW